MGSGFWRQGGGWGPELRSSRFGAQPSLPKKNKGPGHSFAHVRIRDKVLALSTAADLLELSASMRQEFDLFHTVTAFRRMGASPDCDNFRSDGRLSGHVARVCEFVLDESTAKDPRGLSDISWSCARLAVWHTPLLDAIASQARARLSQFDPQGRVNTVWAFAKLGMCDHPLLDSLAAEALSKL